MEIEKYNKLNKNTGDINTYFNKINKEIQDLSVSDPRELNKFYHDVLEDVIESDHQKRNYYGINKRSKLSDKISFNQSLEKMADNLINATENKEYPVLSKYADKMNGKREKSINLDEDDNGELSEFHDDIIALFSDNTVNEIFKDRRLSESHKRKLRKQNVKPEDMEEHPEMFTMFLAAITLGNELGLSEDMPDEEKLEKYTSYIHKFNKMLDEEKKKTFYRWKQGKSRLDDVQVERFKDNPYNYKFEYLQVNKPPVKYKDNDELQLKWIKLLKFYGLANNGANQFKKAKRIRNDIEYEIAVMRERFNPPVGFRGRNVSSMDVNTGIKEIENVFDFADPVHIEKLLLIDTYYGNPVKDENNKSVRYKYNMPIFQVLEDRYSSRDNYICQKFRQLLQDSNLKDYESTIVDMIINPTYLEQKGNDREDFHGAIMAELNNTYDMEIDNMRQLNTLIRKLSRKISNTYLDEIEKDKLGTLQCSKCREYRVASDRNFGKDKRNVNRKGFKSVCKECSNT